AARRSCQQICSAPQQSDPASEHAVLHQQSHRIGVCNRVAECADGGLVTARLIARMQLATGAIGLRIKEQLVAIAGEDEDAALLVDAESAVAGHSVRCMHGHNEILLTVDRLGAVDPPSFVACGEKAIVGAVHPAIAYFEWKVRSSRLSR